MNQVTAKYIILIGVIIIVCGLIVYFFHGSLKWLGNLPGDFRIERGNFCFYFPFVTMLIVSVLVNLVINIIKKLF